MDADNYDPRMDDLYCRHIQNVLPGQTTSPKGLVNEYVNIITFS